MEPTQTVRLPENGPKEDYLGNKNNNRMNTNGTEMDITDYAVYLKNVCKSYDKKNQILRNACMNVKRGTIYSLLGSSGCGKTTMLSCIVGFEKWESGELLVFGKKPGTKESGIPGRKLGYMPQELALYRHLTIREIIHCFGHFYIMTNTEIVDMTNHLYQLLDLPKVSTLVKDLSGGQRRRVSLALAMMHSPELLVLDEPTAGVDPLLRINIWDHLYKLVDKTGTTVLITTHYIEEARHSNMIGVLRNGRILVEDSPANILDRWKCNLLEDAVLQICRKDNSSMHTYKPVSNVYQSANKIEFGSSSWSKPFHKKKTSPYNNNLSPKGTFKKEDGFDGISSHAKSPQHPPPLEHKSSYSGYKIEGHRDDWLGSVTQCFQKVYGFSTVILLTYIRDPIYLFAILLLPTLQGGLSLYAVGSKPNGLHLGIVNGELTNWTRECDLPKHFGNSCELTFLSCQYINELKREDLLILDPYDNEDEALSQVELGNSWGFLKFPENFTESSIDLVGFKQFGLNESYEGSRIRTRLDHSGYVRVSLIIKNLIYSYMRFVNSITNLCGADTQMTDIPLDFRPPVYGTYEDDFSGYSLPGVVLLSLFGIGIGVASISHVSDRKDRTLIRARSAGLASSDIIISHFVTQVAITIVQLAIWNVMLHTLFDFVNHGSTWLWTVISVLVEMTGVACGLLLGQLCGNEIEVLFSIIFLYGIFVLNGCVFLPVDTMAKAWQYVSHLLPTFLPTMSARSVVVRGLGITHSLVWPGLVLSVIWIVVLSFIVFIMINRTRK